jgi:hypothetical protein
MKKLLATLALLLIAQTAFAFDHRHAAWDALLKKQVVLISNGHASQVNRYLDYDWALNATKR